NDAAAVARLDVDAAFDVVQRRHGKDGQRAALPRFVEELARQAEAEHPLLAGQALDLEELRVGERGQRGSLRAGARGGVLAALAVAAMTLHRLVPLLDPLDHLSHLAIQELLVAE